MSIKSVKEASSWSTYCAKASIVYLGTTISQEWGFERQTRGPVVREVPAGAAQHAHEVAVSRSYGSVRLRRRRRRGRRRRRRRLGTCLTKHSCGRYLVHATARTDEWGPTGGQSDAPKTRAILPRTGTGEENSDAATRVGALLACQCTNHSPFTPFSAALV